MAALTWADGDVLMYVHAQPGAKKSEFAGLHGEALKIRIQAPPLEGRANKELCRFLAQAFGVSLSQVEFVSGESARQKRLRICAPQRIPEALAELLTR